MRNFRTDMDAKLKGMTILLCLGLFLMGVSGVAGQNESSAKSGKGAVIVVVVEGEARTLESGKEGQGVIAKPGMVLAEGDLLNVPKAGKVTLLLSNGTLVTAQEETRMKIGKFEQEPFEANGRKVSDLEGEPSTSKVEIDLDLGSLVVKTKSWTRIQCSTLIPPWAQPVSGVRSFKWEWMPEAVCNLMLRSRRWPLLHLAVRLHRWVRVRAWMFPRRVR